MTNKDKETIADFLYMCSYVGEITDTGVEVDGVVDFDAMMKIADYLIKQNEYVRISKKEYEQFKEFKTKMEILVQSNQIQRETLLYGMELLKQREELLK